MLTTYEVAKRLGVSPASVRRWVRLGVMKQVKIGRAVRFSEEEVARVERDGIDETKTTKACDKPR